MSDMHTCRKCHRAFEVPARPLYYVCGGCGGLAATNSIEDNT